jgi:hypothetical protein
MAVRTKRVRRTHIICPTTGGAHALRHELDKMGALSRRRGNIVVTTASSGKIAKARKRARHSVHHGRSR